ncbi:MAG TPA: SMP-30/gluconolactonase/LRE family protein [Solirubrobacterales bacterium]|nr:SMP-30/gluconolactonase/LRE family protein [Solirubrobacterales bacterium]
MNGVVLLRRTCVILLGIALIAAAPANAAPDCSPRPAARVIASNQGVLESIASDKRGRIFFTDTDASRLLRIDRRGEQPVVLKEAIDGILAVMVDRDNSLVLGIGNSNTDAAADNGNAGLMRVDPDTGETIEIITMGLDMSNGITRGRDGAYYASNDFGHGIDRFFGGQVTDNWSTVETPNGLVIDSTGRYLYAAQTFKPASVARIDLATGTSTTYAEAGAADVAAGPDGLTRDSYDRLYVAANGAGEIWRVNRDRTICALARGYPTVSSVSFGGGTRGFPSRNLYAVTFTGQIVELVNVLD